MSKPTCLKRLLGPHLPALSSPGWQSMSLKMIFQEPSAQTSVVHSWEVVIPVNTFDETELCLHEGRTLEHILNIISISFSLQRHI